jgi:hypothetical protein
MASTLGKVKYIGEGDISARPTDPSGHLYLALGFPNSANKKVDHVRRVVPNRIWPYAGLAVRNDALARKLGITGEHHIFIKFEKRSKDFGGAIVNSKDPTGMSGGGLFDLGNLARPENLAEGAVCKARLTGLLIEVHRGAKSIVAVSMGTVVRALLQTARL